jgi:hypothetical protein
MSKKSVQFEGNKRLARTMSGQYYHQPQALLNDRRNAKGIDKNAMIILNGKRQDYEWPSTNKEDYYYRAKDVARSRMEREREGMTRASDQDGAQKIAQKLLYEINGVDRENNTVTVCDIAGTCITIALTVAAAAKLAGLFGGKTRNRKTRNQKTRNQKTRNQKTRHHRKK